MALRFLSPTVLFVVLVGCASHTAPKALGDATTPRVGWVIMQGSSADSPDEEYVCQSNPRDRCVLKASTAGKRSFSEVHLYFHPIGSSTTYEGTVQMSFFGQGPSPLAVAVDAKGVGNDSVVGAVTNKPGEYALNVTVSATTPAGPVPVAERIPVVVE